MQVKLGVLADFASISREGKLNIMGIFDEINVAALPAALPIFYIVVSYGTGAAEFDKDKTIEIALQDQDGNILLRVHQSVHISRPSHPGTRGTVNQIHALAGLPFTQPGNYEFAISVDGHLDPHQIPLRINPPTEVQP